ncbi:MAG: Bax inhibitor-1/YccA family protein [Alphaproteobacteria bacterium]|nr:Bax inhibitor-1/YccA family protein [Alphaproteobacteria bacterium]
MADYNPRVITSPTSVGVIDAGLRAYMLRVYNYMLVALSLTGAVAWATATTSFGSLFFRPVVVAGHVVPAISGLGLAAVFAPLALVFFLGFRLNRMSLGAAQLTFWGYAALVGISLGILVFAYTGQSVAQVFFITAAAFGGLSLWGYTTQRDLTGFGSFLIMGAWGLLIAMLVNFFLKSPMIMWMVSIAGVGIFAGLTAYDTQKIKEMYVSGDDGTVMGRKAIFGALNLYIDFVNMFQFLLYLLGNRR